MNQTKTLALYLLVALTLISISFVIGYFEGGIEHGFFSETIIMIFAIILLYVISGY